MVSKRSVCVEVASRMYLTSSHARYKQRYAYLTKNLQTNFQDHYDSTSRIVKADATDYARGVTYQVSMGVVVEVKLRA